MSGPWTARYDTIRDYVLLAIGAGMLIAETIGSLLGRPADIAIIGAGLTLCGLVPVLQRGGA